MFGPGVFRFFLALVVFVHHSTSIGLGNAAVFIFFGLSGYWISRMWEEKYSPHYPVFVLSRFWRLAPIFIVSSLVGWATARAALSNLNWPAEILSSLFILGYASLSFWPIVPAWSLDIELQFYLLAPVLISILVRRWQMIGAVAALAAVGAWFHLGHTVIPYLACFAAGVVVATQRLSVSGVAAGWSGAASALLIVAVAASPWRGMLFGGRNFGDLFAYNMALNVVVAFAALPLALWTASLPDNKFDRMLGDLSYIVYLMHYPVVLAIDTGHGNRAHRLLMLLFALIVTIALSLALWAIVDRPMNRMRARWLRHAVRPRK